MGTYLQPTAFHARSHTSSRISWGPWSWCSLHVDQCFPSWNPPNLPVHRSFVASPFQEEPADALLCGVSGSLSPCSFCGLDLRLTELMGVAATVALLAATQCEEITTGPTGSELGQLDGSLSVASLGKVLLHMLERVVSHLRNHGKISMSVRETICPSIRPYLFISMYIHMNTHKFNPHLSISITQDVALTRFFRIFRSKVFVVLRVFCSFIGYCFVVLLLFLCYFIAMFCYVVVILLHFFWLCYGYFVVMLLLFFCYVVVILWLFLCYCVVICLLYCCFIVIFCCFTVFFGYFIAIFCYFIVIRWLCVGYLTFFPEKTWNNQHINIQ